MEEAYVLTVVPTKVGTRLLLTQGPDELMRAVLPSMTGVHHERAAPSLLH